MRTSFQLVVRYLQDFCPTPCEAYAYKASLSFADYPTSYYAEILKKEPLIVQNFRNYSGQIDRGLLASSIALVNVYYEELSYKSVVEMPAITLNVI